MDPQRRAHPRLPVRTPFAAPRRHRRPVRVEVWRTSATLPCLEARACTLSVVIGLVAGAALAAAGGCGGRTGLLDWGSGTRSQASEDAAAADATAADGPTEPPPEAAVVDHAVPPPGCGPTTCLGCCLADACVAGSVVAACGYAGAACQDCLLSGTVCIPNQQPQVRPHYVCQPGTCDTCYGCCRD